MNQTTIDRAVKIATDCALNGKPVEKIVVGFAGFIITYKKKTSQDIIKTRCRILRLLNENEISLEKALELQSKTDQELMYLQDDVLLMY